MKVEVGDPSISCLLLQAHTDEKKVLIVEGGSERIAGITTEEIAFVEIEGKAALRRTQGLRSSEFGNRTTTSVVFRSDFQPLSHQDETEEYKISIQYDGQRVVGTKSKVGQYEKSNNSSIADSVFNLRTDGRVWGVLIGSGKIKTEEYTFRDCTVNGVASCKSTYLGES